MFCCFDSITSSSSRKTFPMIHQKQQQVDFLILGKGWTGDFLVPELVSKSISYSATTRDGRDGTIKWEFQPDAVDCSSLPNASTVLITFPITSVQAIQSLCNAYSRSCSATAKWILLGSTRPWQNGHDLNRHSPRNNDGERNAAEDWLLAQPLDIVQGCVLNLSGLYGGNRMPKNWLSRVASTLEKVRQLDSLHLIHGKDVSLAILAIHEAFTPRERWILTDLEGREKKSV